MFTYLDWKQTWNCKKTSIGLLVLAGLFVALARIQVGGLRYPVIESIQGSRMLSAVCFSIVCMYQYIDMCFQKVEVNPSMLVRYMQWWLSCAQVEVEATQFHVRHLALWNSTVYKSGRRTVSKGLCRHTEPKTHVMRTKLGSRRVFLCPCPSPWHWAFPGPLKSLDSHAKPRFLEGNVGVKGFLFRCVNNSAFAFLSLCSYPLAEAAQQTWFEARAENLALNLRDIFFSWSMLSFGKIISLKMAIYGNVLRSSWWQFRLWALCPRVWQFRGWRCPVGGGMCQAGGTMVQCELRQCGLLIGRMMEMSFTWNRFGCGNLVTWELFWNP